MASPELAGGDGSSYDFHLRSLSGASRDSAAAADPASDPNLLQSVRSVCEMCRTAKEAKDEMVARAFPVMGKLFQRCAAAPMQAVASTGVLLLNILQFFLDFVEAGATTGDAGDEQPSSTRTMTRSHGLARRGANTSFRPTR